MKGNVDKGIDPIGCLASSLKMMCFPILNQIHYFRHVKRCFEESCDLKDRNHNIVLPGTCFLFFFLFERTSNHRIGSIIKAHITISLLVIGHSYIRLNIWKLSQEVISQKKKSWKTITISCYPHLTMNSHLFHGKVISINGTN